MVAKAVRPRIPMALLVPVAYAPDLIELLLAQAGHRNREISHSLISIGIGATIVALAYFLAKRDRASAAVLWLTYASHWPADFITGRKPTWPGGPTVGLFLYQRPVADAVVESIMVVVCWLIYRASLSPASRRRAVGFLVPIGLVAMQIVFYANPSLRK
jgi:membrane-bound metal-dependent hydrolase YbcI (DUF457 family)